MRNKKILNIFCAVIWVMQLAVEGMTLALIYRLGMLPDLYLGIVAGGFLLVWGLMGLMMFLHGRKSKGGYLRRALACILAVLICLGCAGISTVVSDVNDTMDAITNQPEVNGVTMAVYVRSEDPAQSLADAAGYTFAILSNYETQRIQKAIQAIETELGSELSVGEYASVQEMLEALYSGEIDAVILNSAYVMLLEEDEQFEDFSDKTRIIFETVVPEETQVVQSGLVSVDPTAIVSDHSVLNQVEDITNTPFVVYISGSDTRSYLLTTSRSDVNILMAVNPETKQVLLLNTPRDYYVANPAGNGAKDKLTHCGIYGISCSMQALADLYSVNVDYYAQINFTGVETLVDAIGGVDVYSDVAFTALWTYPISQGMNHLNGAQALAYARDRYSFASGDNARGKHQMQVITAVIEKATSGTTIITNYASILESLQGMLSTNLTSEEIGNLVKMQLSDMAQWNVLSYAVTGAGGSDITYSMPGLHCYVMYPNQTMVDYGAELIDRVLAGEILTSADMTCPD